MKRVISSLSRTFVVLFLLGSLLSSANNINLATSQEISTQVQDLIPGIYPGNQVSMKSEEVTAGTTTRASVASDGTQANGNSGYLNLSISHDGRFVAFYSEATNLVLDDTNGSRDVFVYDRTTGSIKRVSVASDGKQGNSSSDGLSISANGRYVAFRSTSSNLVSNDNNSIYDIFVHDLYTGITSRVSVASDGTEGSGASEGGQVISADGRFVAFRASASNLVSGDTNNSPDLFVHDRITGATSLVSVASDGAQGNNDSGWHLSISADGRYIAFISWASNLVPNDTNNIVDCFVHDMQNGNTARISVESSGNQANGDCYYPSISADGRFVAFTSEASNLVEGDTNGVVDIFLHDVQTGETTRIPVAWDGSQANGHSANSSISSDGRYVAYMSYADNLIPNDMNGGTDVFVFDRVNLKTERISVNSYGEESSGSGIHVGTAISEDGQIIAFASDANNLVLNDTNGKKDVFIHDRTFYLDLPVSYTNFSVAANGNYGGNNPGRVNSWFDHNPTGQTVTIWSSRTSSGAAQTSVMTCASYDRAGCYDGHNGIDFRKTQSNESIYAAADGTVFGVVNNCGGCITGYGNRVWINHGNGYATLYGHLSIASVTNGTEITNRLAQPIGVMGSTGHSTGIHLHFGLYYDQNGDGQWTESEAVDPYGWQGANYLWIHSLSAQQLINSSGGSASTPSGNLAVTVPAGAVSSPVTLELWDIPPVAGASATLRSTGNSFWMRILEWLTGGSSPSLMASASTNSFDVPVTVAIHYDPSSMPHLDTSQLTINQWDDVGQAWIALPTTFDTVNQQASAQTSQPGHFDLQAPLVCPADTLEPNDNYDGASVVQTDGTLMSNLFDVVQDEDWFKFNATVGIEYAIQTKNLAAGVDTVLEIYDTDGVTLLGSDDNGGGGNASSLIWQAPQNGLYFLRVSRATGSGYGCNTTYQLRVVQSHRLFMPVIMR